MAKSIITVNYVAFAGADGEREASIQAGLNGWQINCTGRGKSDLAALQAAIVMAISKSAADESTIEISCHALDQMLEKRAEEVHDRALDKAGIQSNHMPNLAY